MTADLIIYNFPHVLADDSSNSKQCVKYELPTNS